jgi:8-oxo-dGTP pyrophosphatase MutT (NUDIX family)
LKYNIQHIIKQLKEQLNKELPGIRAQSKMLPPGRVLNPPSNDQSVIQSGVLFLLFSGGEKIKTAVIRRPVTMKNHAGQIAFPGGKVEPEDNDITDTVLRETKEEIGIDPKKIQILGKLSPIYLQVSNFIINPVIGWCHENPDFVIDNTEVDSVHILEIDELTKPECLVVQNVETFSGLLAVPGFSIDGLFIWGATSMIISEFIEVYNNLTPEM